EASKSEDMGNYYRISADNRDLNYDKYLSNGDKKIEKATEYTSANTERLDVDGTIEKIMTAKYVRDEFERMHGKS
ncbi:MAG: UDP-glucose 4-epimerase, partial [Candidatus Nomurabacteria bacterium]|nr:UDP-glucose 4-epimerase [Candidatus Nomurabacteria bacterium]